jgi:hypothetical protein
MVLCKARSRGILADHLRQARFCAIPYPDRTLDIDVLVGNCPGTIAVHSNHFLFGESSLPVTLALGLLPAAIIAFSMRANYRRAG